jgi:hypothetical protein
MSSLLAVDDGFFSGNFNLADILFLIATIVFAIAFIIRVLLRPVPLPETLIAAGLACVALGWLVV